MPLIHSCAEQATKINPSRLCRACLQSIREEPGVFFGCYLGGKWTTIYFHRECLLEAVKSISLPTSGEARAL